MTPEEQARKQIDAQLAASGWLVQDFKAVDFSAGRGIALREVPLTTGPCDYLGSQIQAFFPDCRIFVPS